MRRSANSELPEWFDIKKYKDASKLDVADWYIQLYVRSYYMKIQGKSFVDFTNPAALSYFPGGDLMAENFSNLLQTIRENPVIDLVNNPQYLACFGRENKMAQRFASWPAQPIHSITPIEINFLVRSLNPDKRNLILSTDENMQILNEDWAHEPLHACNMAWMGNEIVSVNPNMPDDFLKAEFSKYLKEMRLRDESIPAKTNNLEKWADMGILPYIDLKIWAQREGKSLSNSQIAAAIYPSTSDGSLNGETVRKTLEPTVNKLLSEKTLRQLWVLSQRNAEKNVS